MSQVSENIHVLASRVNIIFSSLPIIVSGKTRLVVTEGQGSLFGEVAGVRATTLFQGCEHCWPASEGGEAPHIENKVIPSCLGAKKVA